ncbi:MAG: hypothetical protein R3C12_13675 [Planctomycetaceae bacterium]|nr:hypothetical protein [Planctomycetaceae bacterium]
MSVTLPQSLPDHSRITRIAYLPVETPHPDVIAEFPAPVRMRAVRLSAEDDTYPSPSPALRARLTLLSIPVAEPDERVLESAREWVQQHAEPDAGLASRQPTQLLMFHGMHIFWGRGCAALLAAADRLPVAEQAFIEAAYFEGELYEIETLLNHDWPLLEQDIPCAFDFSARNLSRQPELRQRFGKVLQLQSRLSRILPYLEAPHAYPPTVASQIGERLRERMRVEYRIEWLDGQLEVFEQVYELCGDRSSNFVHARATNALEWVIILLLVVQILLMLFETLSVVEA